MSWPSDKTFELASPPPSANLPLVVSHLSQCLHAMIKNSKIYAQKFRVLEARLPNSENSRTELTGANPKQLDANYHNSPKTALLTRNNN
ncbi:hypothetical protein BYT27DRAFT_7254183 [Phlegmacium glaucopus]|nr:hypothetical protein BYT27DRAFT_7254183 [Phlegmacium glaucopus]